MIGPNAGENNGGITNKHCDTVDPPVRPYCTEEWKYLDLSRGLEDWKYDKEIILKCLDNV